jgi:hypothetical protein
MRHILFFYFLFSLLLLTSISQATQTVEKISLNIPESTLAEALSSALPLEYTTSSKKLQGTITLKSISELQLLNQQLACRIQLAGRDLTLTTEMAGQKITLNLGAVDMNFKANARLRFDHEKQTLFLTPVIDPATSGNESGKGDIGDVLMQLVDGREFPIEMQDIEPIVAKTGAKTLIITTKIADISIQKKRLQFLLEPQISTH